MRVGVWHHRTVPVRKYGGTERVVVWLTRALRRLGHEPVLLTPPGSRSDDARVVPLPKDVMERAEEDPAFPVDDHLPSDLDVLHCFSRLRARTSLPRIRTVSGHGEPVARPEFVYVSRNHMERMGGDRFVHNGLDPRDFTYREEKEDWFLFLSKARWSVKGVDRAEAIAKRAGVQLVIAGGWRFNWTWKITSVGMVGDEKKRRLLAGARALVFPVRWDEPFGLVVTEALASGTPVVASRRGSLPELVTEDVGILCDTEDDFVAALDRIDEIDPAACRRRLEEAFTAERMAREYLELYRQARAGAFGGAEAGAADADVAAEAGGADAGGADAGGAGP